MARLYTPVMDPARTKHGLTAAALARRRDLRPRTVYRDLHALEVAGFPITSGDGARWKLIEGWEARVPFPLPLGQLLALHLARAVMKPLRATPMAREFDALYERLAGPIAAGTGAQGELSSHACGQFSRRARSSPSTPASTPLCWRPSAAPVRSERPCGGRPALQAGIAF